jgi:hypothetical protein
MNKKCLHKPVWSHICCDYDIFSQEKVLVSKTLKQHVHMPGENRNVMKCSHLAACLFLLEDFSLRRHILIDIRVLPGCSTMPYAGLFCMGWNGRSRKLTIHIWSQGLQWVNVILRITRTWVLDFVHHPEFSSCDERKTPTLLGPLEGANFIHWITSVT